VIASGQRHQEAPQEDAEAQVQEAAEAIAPQEALKARGASARVPRRTRGDRAENGPDAVGSARCIFKVLQRWFESESGSRPAASAAIIAFFLHFSLDDLRNAVLGSAATVALVPRIVGT
jgi:hypothetical protein